MAFIPFKFITLPRKIDVIIIGSGIMGCAAAYYLAKRGIKSLVLDKGQIASKQSSKAWGFVRQQGREEPEIPLMKEAIKLWEGLEQELGVDLKWRQSGCLYMASKQTQIDSFEAWAEMARSKYDLSTKVLTASEVRKLIPNWSAPSVGGLYTPNDGQAEPKLVAAAFAAKAAELGAFFIEGCGAISLETTGQNVSGVHTERGFVEASQVICASGTNSYRLLRSVGVKLPQQVVRASCVRTNSQPKITDITVCGNGLGFRQKEDGSINLGDGVKVDVDITLGHLRAIEWYLPNLWSQRKSFDFHFNSVTASDAWIKVKNFASRKYEYGLNDQTFNHLINDRSKEKLVKLLGKVSPLLSNAKIVESWSEQIDVLPDGIPVIDNLSNPQGLLVTTGFCGHGFAMGPLIGKIVADLVDSGDTNLDLREFRLSRFESKNIRQPISMV